MMTMPFPLPALLLASALPAPSAELPGGDCGVCADAPGGIVSSSPDAEPSQKPRMPSRHISFETTEGTFMSVDVSPDGETLVFDLLGDIYRLPIAGGDAVALTSGRSWDQSPRFSPDGRHVYFVSDRHGFNNIWRLTLFDQSLRQVTHTDSHIMGGPNWSEDGDHLLVGLGQRETGISEVILQAVNPVTGTMSPINAPEEPWFDVDTFDVHRPPIRVFSAAGSAGSEVFFSQATRDDDMDRRTISISSFNAKSQVATSITPVDASYNEYKPQLSHSGMLLAYFRQYQDRRTELRIRDRMTGKDEAVVELTDADDASYTPGDDARPNYAFAPDDEDVIFWHGGKIHRVRLSDGYSKVVPFRVRVERNVWHRVLPPVGRLRDTGEPRIIRWPSLSRNGQTLAFAALGHVWVMDVSSGETRRITDSPTFGYMPAVSPDGASVAYVGFYESEDGKWSSRLLVADIGSGTKREVLANPKSTYLLPKWSQDGRKIALIREVDFAGDANAMFGWTSATSGPFHEVAKAPASKERLSWSIYARFVGFDASGRNLLFSFPRSRKEVILSSAGLDGSEHRVLAVGTPEVDGIAPEPNLTSIALTRKDGTVWVVPFDAGVDQRYVSTGSPNARRMSISGGYYVSWNSTDEVTFSFGKNLYRYKLTSAELTSFAVDVSFGEPIGDKPIVFSGARLITMSGSSGAGPVLEGGTIIMRGQRITAVGRRNIEIPRDAIVIDVAGKTIMPGLLDTHYHRIGGSDGAIGLSAFKLPNPSFSDNSAIAYGVTTAWEPGGPANDGSPATADLQRAGRIVGPRWSHSAAGSVGYPWEQLTTYARALAAVEQHKNLGVAVLKEYNTPTREQQQWLSAAAHQLELGIVSHIQSFDGMMTRIVDGYTGGDHPYIPVPFFKDVHELMRRTGYIWTPNLVASGGSLGSHRDIRRYFRAALDKDQSAYDKLTAAPTARKKHRELPYEAHRVSRVAKQAALAAELGVHVGISGHNMPGSGVHQELWLLHKGGLSIEHILRAATIGNAEKLGLQKETGSLEIGKIADFLILDDNPLDDILDTLSLRYTVQGGIIYDSDTTKRLDLATMEKEGTAMRRGKLAMDDLVAQ